MDEQAITFMDEDAERIHHPHDNVIVITLLIADYTTRRVLVDNGSSVDILYYPAFSADEVRTRPAPQSKLPLGRLWWNEGAACWHSYITCGGGSISATGNQRREFPCGRLFVLLQCHNWKTNFKQLEGCYIYLPPIYQVPTEPGVGQVQGDQLAARECYLAMLAMDEQVQTMNIEEKRVVAEPTEALEDISLDENNRSEERRVGKEC